MFLASELLGFFSGPRGAEVEIREEGRTFLISIYHHGLCFRGDDPTGRWSAACRQVYPTSHTYKVGSRIGIQQAKQDSPCFTLSWCEEWRWLLDASWRCGQLRYRHSASRQNSGRVGSSRVNMLSVPWMLLTKGGWHWHSDRWHWCPSEKYTCLHKTRATLVYEYGVALCAAMAGNWSGSGTPIAGIGTPHGISTRGAHVIVSGLAGSSLCKVIV